MRLRALNTSMPKLRASTKLSRIRSVIDTFGRHRGNTRDETTKNNLIP